MKRISSRTKCTLALAFAGMLAIGSAMAEKPSWAGGGKADRDERADQRGNQKRERRETGESSSHDSGRRDHFKDLHHVIVRDYYSEH